MNAPANIQPKGVVQTGETLPIRPLNFAIIVMPGFSHLALHAYIEPFRIANTFSPVPLFRWQLASPGNRSVVGANGLAITVDTTTEDLGAGSGNDIRFDHLVIVAGEPIEKQLTPSLSTFLRSVARRGIAISAIGTASWLLAQSGLLGETRCTIHWSRLAAFSEVFHRPRIRDTLFVKDGQFSTCAGELAAFDLAVDLIGSHAGVVIAQEVCRHATVEGQRSGTNRQTGPSGLAFAGASEKLVAAMQVMEENVETPLSMDEVAAVVGISRRQLERLFTTHLGLPPVRHYLKIRVDRAKRLVQGTRMPLIEVAVACGFVSASHFSKCFRVVHGVTPQQCRLAVPAWVGPGLGSC